MGISFFCKKSGRNEYVFNKNLSPRKSLPKGLVKVKNEMFTCFSPSQRFPWPSPSSIWTLRGMPSKQRMFGIPAFSDFYGKVDLLHLVSTEKKSWSPKNFGLSSPRLLYIFIYAYLCPTAKATGQGQEQLRLSATDFGQDRASCTSNYVSWTSPTSCGHEAQFAWPECNYYRHRGTNVLSYSRVRVDYKNRWTICGRGCVTPKHESDLQGVHCRIAGWGHWCLSVPCPACDRRGLQTKLTCTEACCSMRWAGHARTRTHGYLKHTTL